MQNAIPTAVHFRHAAERPTTTRGAREKIHVRRKVSGGSIATYKTQL